MGGLLFIPLYTVYWDCHPGEHISKVVNLVTQNSPDGTYMQLGDAISKSPNTYPVDLKVSIEYGTT